ncbi:DNA alkylation repair protein [Polymorphospora sp. NPDC050346]|uniref:DNA alkylation repair protein n=1 Tax=Polymorphospora sp. NPDC050346 TaxID=3155780 RepID=UPI0033FFB8F3
MPTADELLNAAAVDGLARCLLDVAPGHPLPALRRTAAALEGRTLSERCHDVRDALLTDLPDDYDGFAAVVRAALERPGFTGWMTWPVTEAVARRALDAGPADRFDAGLALLADLTPRLTAEFAIRSFLAADLDRTLAVALEWTRHPDPHVRRLASEGTRPYLPWARRVRALFDRPAATTTVLDALYRDDSEYVRRSVANHLNDLSRIDPELATTTATRWLDRADEHTAKVVWHGLRTLVKKGDPAALGLLGFGPAPDIVVTGPVLGEAVVASGGDLLFEVTLENRGPDLAAVAIDYVVHHRRANGTLSPKVFKLTTRRLDAGASLTISRRHSFAPISTRTYHPGEHAVEVQVNGVRHGLCTFRLGSP